MANGAGLSIVKPTTARNLAAAGKVITRPRTPAQPFRYDLLLPALRQPSRVATRFLTLVAASFAETLGL